MSGYCSIERLVRPSRPRMTMKTEITVESTGLLINLSNFMINSLGWNYIRGEGCVQLRVLLLRLLGGLVGSPRFLGAYLHLVLDSDAYALNYYAVAGFQARSHDIVLTVVVL